VIRPFEPPDLDAALAVNQQCVPEVGSLDAPGLADLVAASPWTCVVEHEGAIAGLLVGLVEGADYASPNYRFFAARHDRFAYVDRIALAESARGQGHGPALYEAFQTWARGTGRPVLCAEVNLDPPNPRSLRFHQLFGFDQVGEQIAYGIYRVAMLEKSLDDPRGPAGSDAPPERGP
jgi:uncharacterized protein